MPKPPFPFTALPEAQRTQTLECFAIIRLLDEEGQLAQPYLTVIEDDYSRAIGGYRLSFQEPTALITVLTLRQAIWRKEDPHWHACGIPTPTLKG